MYVSVISENKGHCRMQNSEKWVCETFCLNKFENVIKLHIFQSQGSAIEAVQDGHTANNRGVKLIC